MAKREEVSATLPYDRLFEAGAVVQDRVTTLQTKDHLMGRIFTLLLLTGFLAGCHATELGRSIGFPAPQRTAPPIAPDAHPVH